MEKKYLPNSEKLLKVTEFKNINISCYVHFTNVMNIFLNKLTKYSLVCTSDYTVGINNGKTASKNKKI